ncbi:hypothetical protein [Spirosoma rigui]|uniref:hypothetical protein n=1 Tax=Spirosoma rigui TaxID=564064 RepID=UPI0012D2AD83|nr:hypothetical protein [Spirosoma rigui]
MNELNIINTTHYMRIFSPLFLFHICLFIEPCKAQECESVQKLKAKDGFTYMGMVDTPKNTNTTQNQVLMLVLGKGVTKSDTTYLLNTSINAVSVSENSPSSGILLQFEDGFEIAKPGQTLEVFSMLDGKAILSAEVELTLAEMQRMKDTALLSITLASSKTGIVESFSKSVRVVANCLSVTW